MSPIVLSSMLVVANIMGAGMIVPQVVRLRRYRNTRGISASWIGVGLAMNLWWVAYGLASGLWGIIPVSAVAFLLYLVMTAQYAGINGTTSLRGCVTGMVGVGIVPLPALILDGWATAGVVVGLCYAVQFAPAALMRSAPTGSTASRRSPGRWPAPRPPSGWSTASTRATRRWWSAEEVG